MRPLWYYINVTLDGCCDHRAMLADEGLRRHAAENLDRADALLFGRGRLVREFFGSIRPAATMVEVARLIDPGMLVEIEAEAYVAP